MATYKVGADGKAPSGLKAGDQVVTAGGTYTIGGVNANGSYSGAAKTGNTNTYNYGGGYATAPASAPAPAPVNQMQAASNTYRVGADGKAPVGLKTGDQIVTGGGTYTIGGVNPDGSYTNVTKTNDTNTWTYKGGYANNPVIEQQKQPQQQTAGAGGISNYNLSDYNQVNPNGITPQKPNLAGLDLGDLYGITYDKDAILNLLNGATKAQYASQKEDYQDTVDDFYNQMTDSQSSLLDTLRSSQANAVATGASKGMAAAQQLSTILGLQDVTQQTATDLGNEKNKLDAEENAAYATNENTALTTSNSLKEALANLASTNYGYDTQKYASELDFTAALQAVLGEIIQSQNSGNATVANAEANLAGTKYAADSNQSGGPGYSYNKSSGSSYSGSSGSGSGTGSTTKTPTAPAAASDLQSTGVGNDTYAKNSDGSYTVYPAAGGNGTKLDAAGYQTYRMEGTLDAVNNNSYAANIVAQALPTAGSAVNTSTFPLAKPGSWQSTASKLTGGTENIITVNGKQYIKANTGAWYLKTRTDYIKTSDPFTSLVNAKTTPSRITVDSRSYTYDAGKGYWSLNGKRVSATTVASALKSGSYFVWSN